MICENGSKAGEIFAQKYEFILEVDVILLQGCQTTI